MAKINENYEAMVIFSQKLDEEGVNALTAKFDDMIKANAENVEINVWGKRKLAYVLWSFTSGTAFPAELERVLGITDGVIRFLITTK